MSPEALVTFAGTGPGDPGLIAVRAQQALAGAQVVVAGRGPGWLWILCMIGVGLILVVYREG